MAQGSLRTGVLAVLVLAAGFTAWALFRPHEAPERSAFEDGAPGPQQAPPSANAAPGRESPAPGRAPATPAPGVPRLLPADAALEDLRDALALAPDARQAALDEAWQATGRIAAARRRVLAELHQLIADEEDPLLRAVATSALGTSRSDRNVRWLQTRLASATTVEDRVGALLALAWADEKAGRPRAGTLRAPTLGGIAIDYAALPDSASMRAAVARFLDGTQGERARDALPVVLQSVQASVEYASLLVSDAGALRSFVGALSSGDRNKLIEAALTHAELPSSVRNVLKKIR